MSEFQNTIKAYLDEFAKGDKHFAEKYAGSGKSIEDCCSFIILEVKKKRVEVMTDDEVFGLAVHFFDEDGIKAPAAAPSCRVTVASGKNTKAVRKPEKATGKTKAGKGKKVFVQPLLFGMGEEVEE